MHPTREARHVSQRLGRDEGDVAIENEDRAGESVERRGVPCANGVTGAKPFSLNCHLRGRNTLRASGRHIVHIGTGDDHGACRIERPGRMQHTGPAGCVRRRVEAPSEARIHARALAGGEHDDCQFAHMGRAKSRFGS